MVKRTEGELMRKLVSVIAVALWGSACGSGSGGGPVDAGETVDALPCTGNKWTVWRKSGVYALAGITGGQLLMSTGLAGDTTTLVVGQTGFTGDFNVTASFVDLSLVPEESYVQLRVVDGVTGDRYWLVGLYRSSELWATYQSPTLNSAIPPGFEGADGYLQLSGQAPNINLQVGLAGSTILDIYTEYDATRFDVYLATGSTSSTSTAGDQVEVAFTQVDMTIAGVDLSDTFDCDTLGEERTF